MAFAGMFLGAVFVIILIIIYAIAFIELIIGIILMIKKKKVPATILLVLAAIPAVITVIAISVLIYKNEFPKYDTYDGRKVTVSMKNVRIMKEYIRADDMDGLDELLDKHPELIYYQDNNHQSLLEYGLHDHNVEIMQIAVDHGSEFDAEPNFELLIYDYSLERFFDLGYWSFALYKEPDPPKIVYGETTDEMIEAAKFAIDHGAVTVWSRDVGRWTFADSVESWINGDNKISEKDQEFLDYARSVNPF